MSWRNFNILLSLAVASLALSIFVVINDRPINQLPRPQTLLPDLVAQIGNVAHIRLTHGLGLSGVATLDFDRVNGRWIYINRNYPANQELVNETILELSQLQGIEARTHQRAWHATLGLRPPQDLGSAIRFQLSDAQGKVLADILLGNDEKSEREVSLSLVAPLTARKESNFFVRLYAEDQTWLTRGRLPRARVPAAWIDPIWPHIALGRLSRIVITRAEHREIAFDDKGWREGASVDARWYQNLIALRPTDVAPAEQFDFTQGISIEAMGADTTYRYQVLGQGNALWIARTSSNTAESTMAQFAGRAFRFDQEARAVLLPRLSSP